MGRSHLRRFDVNEVGLGVLFEAFPVEKIRAILKMTGRESQRTRRLPATMMVYYVIALGLFVSAGCREVLRRLLDGAKWIWPYQVQISTESAITQARQRLGSRPIIELYREVVRPIAQKATRGAWYRARRVVTLDGTTFDISDSEDNERAFGRPGASRGKSGYPQIRVAGLVENGTHVFFAAEMDGCKVAEVRLARKVIPALRRGMICLADRNFFSYELWNFARNTGAALLWRMRSSPVLPEIRKLADGSYLSKIYPSWRHRHRDEGGVPVRLIRYRINGFREEYRLITTILDPAKAPALELAHLYSNRWTIETAFDEIKTHQRQGRIVLRSKLPELVQQDLFGLLLAHFGIRSIMHKAALREDIETKELSFVHTLNVIHRKLPWLVAFPPSPNFTSTSGSSR